MSGTNDCFVKDALIELLAIKLYEHDRLGENVRRGQITLWPPEPGFRINCWADLADADRELYREMARGNVPLYKVKDDD